MADDVRLCGGPACGAGVLARWRGGGEACAVEVAMMRSGLHDGDDEGGDDTAVVVVPLPAVDSLAMLHGADTGHP